MDTTPAQPAPLVSDRLTQVALDRIIAMAAKLSAGPEWNKWKVYEAAKGAIRDFNLPDDEYEVAIRELAAALDL